VKTIENIERTLEKLKKEVKELLEEKKKNYPVIIQKAIDTRMSSLNTKINNCHYELKRMKKKIGA
jgi:F0F1-type ATP synthase membrane subunit b/b'